MSLSFLSFLIMLSMALIMLSKALILLFRLYFFLPDLLYDLALLYLRKFFFHKL